MSELKDFEWRALVEWKDRDIAKLQKENEELKKEIAEAGEIIKEMKAYCDGKMDTILSIFVENYLSKHSGEEGLTNQVKNQFHSAIRSFLLCKAKNYLSKWRSGR